MKRGSIWDYWSEDHNFKIRNRKPKAESWRTDDDSAWTYRFDVKLCYRAFGQHSHCFNRPIMTNYSNNKNKLFFILQNCIIHNFHSKTTISYKIIQYEKNIPKYWNILIIYQIKLNDVFTSKHSNSLISKLNYLKIDKTNK